MWRYIFWKTISSFVALIFIAIIVYLLFNAFKGDPFIEQKATDPKGYDNLVHRFGIDRSPLEKLGSWIVGVFSGDWGHVYSIAEVNKTIPELFFDPLRKSMLITIPSFLFGTIFGLFLGFIAGYKRGTIFDVIINGFVTIFISIPSFVLAAFTIILAPSLNLPTLFEDAAGQGYMIKTLILPILVITLISLARWTYVLRSEVSSILKSDYILAARTKGYSEWFIFKRYVFRNSMFPFAGALASSFMIVFGSSLIAEKFFNVPGSTSLLIDAANASEINIIMFQIIIFGLIGVLADIVADVAQFSINPLVKANFSSKQTFVVKIKAFIQRWKNNKIIKEVKSD